MSALRMRGGVLAAGVCCVLAAYAVAQQTETRDRAQSGQLDRSDPQQRDRLQSGRTTTQYGQRQTQTGALNQEVEQYVAACLLAKNKAEIEIAQFAQQQAQTPQVKEFAQQMVQEHRQLVQQLQPLAGMYGGASRDAAAQSPGVSSEFESQRSDTTQLPGSPGASQAEPRTATNTAIAPQRGGSAQGNEALQQLMQIEKQITERHTKAVRQELQEKQGAEFDKCFLGTQVASHIHMAAALETIAQQGQGRLAQLAQQAQPTVQQHLEHAKQLMEQLERSPQTGGRAERQSPRTQR